MRFKSGGSFRGRAPVGVHRRGAARRRAGSLFRLEPLEDRRVLAAFTVTSAVDAVDVAVGDGVCADAAGDCTLRAAIQEANTSRGSTITFDPELNGVVLRLNRANDTREDLSQDGDLDVRADVTIQGNGQGATIIDGAGIDRIFEVFGGAKLNLNQLTVRGQNDAPLPADVQRMMAPPDDLIFARSVRPRSVVPNGTVFFDYYSADRTPTEIADYAAHYAANGGRPTSNVKWNYSSAGEGQPDDRAIWNPINHQMPVMSSAGVLEFTRVAGNPDKHTMIRTWDLGLSGAYDNAACNNLTTLRLGALYEFDFDFTIEDNTGSGGADWWNSVDWAIVFQLWGWYDPGETLLNPAFALEVVSEDPGIPGSGPQLAVRQKGASELVHSAYETNLVHHEPLTAPGTHNIRVEYSSDYRVDGNGVSKVWLDDALIFEHYGQTGYKGMCQNALTGPVPFYGAYTSLNLPSPGVEMSVDNIQQTLLSLFPPNTVTANGNRLTVQGTQFDDNIQFLPGPNPEDVEVVFNGVSLGVYQPSSRIIVHGDEGNDTITVDPSISLRVVAYGDEGSDTLIGGSGVNRLVGGGGDDVLVGGPLDDVLIGKSGHDQLTGNAGNDLLRGENGFDTLLGGDGNDTLIGASGEDSLQGGGGDDDLQGGNMNDALDGGDGNDTLNGGAGQDILRGGSGDDVLEGAGGTDILIGNDGQDTLIGGDHRDLLIGGLDADILQGDAGDDILIGAETLYDNDDAALQGLLAEWTSASAYSLRLEHLRGNVSGGLNYPYYLFAGLHVNDDNAIDDLTGGTEVDWFFADLDGTGGDDDVINDLEGGEAVDSLP